MTSSLFGVLNVGVNGMKANTFGTQVASNNASNVGTEGYTRRIANIQSIPGSPTPGLGARAAGENRISDQFIERRLIGARSAMGEAEARSSTLGVLDQVFTDEDGGLADTLSAFEASLADLSSRPNEPAARQVVLTRAGQLARAFNTAAATLDEARVDANTKITDEVRQLNGKLKEIADLGSQISQVEIDGRQASDLRDRRDQLVREVADQVPVKSIEDANGGVTLLLGGSQALVTSDGQVHGLTASPTGTAGDVRIQRVTAGAADDVTDLMTSGRIGGLVSARDGGLADARASIDQLANDIATAYNAVHQTGVGLDGVSGRNLFAPPTGVTGAASNMAVSADVAGQPNNLGAALDANLLPGDNRGALALQDVARNPIALGGTASAAQGLSSLVASAGSALQNANTDLDHTSANTEQIEGLRESVSGVNLDEEMVALMRFQRGYEASLRVIQAADEMLSDLLNLRR